MTNIDLVVCGVGAGATYVYDGESSSSFVLRVDGRPLLLLDCGTGAVQSVFTHVGCLPDHVYVSHNHTDHAGDLPVMLAVEAQKGHRMTLVAENNVLNTLMAHRLHELHSTGELRLSLSATNFAAAAAPYLISWTSIQSSVC